MITTRVNINDYDCIITAKNFTELNDTITAMASNDKTSDLLEKYQDINCMNHLYVDNSEIIFMRRLVTGSLIEAYRHKF